MVQTKNDGAILIVGGSSGLGLGLSISLPTQGEAVWIVSRTRPNSCALADGVHRTWIRADLAEATSIATLRKSLDGVPIKLIVFCAYAWEEKGFENSSAEEIYRIMSVNLSSFLSLALELKTNLESARSARIVAIGSVAGLENATGTRAAYAASKFGLRGAVHSLRALYGSLGIGVSCISPGGIASDVMPDLGVDEALSRYKSQRIPIADFVKIIRMIMTLSEASCVKEIDLPAMLEINP